MRAAPGEPRRGENPMTTYQSRSVSAAHGELSDSSLREVVSNRSSENEEQRFIFMTETTVTAAKGRATV